MAVPCFSFAISTSPIILCALGGKKSTNKVARRGGAKSLCDLSKLRTYSDISKLGKVELKRICSQLNCLSPSLGKKALVSIVCNELNISTCNNKAASRNGKNQLEDKHSKVAWLPYLQKMQNWGKSVSVLPENIEIQDVKGYLIGSGLSGDQVKKYKTLRSWQHKQGVHSLRFELL